MNFYHGNYILNDLQQVVPCRDLSAWANWMQFADRTVARSEVMVDGDTLTVSTVFLGIDHSFLGGEPILFETMVWRAVPFTEQGQGRAWLHYQVRYRTWAEAEMGHKTALRLLENGEMLAWEVT